MTISRRNILSLLGVASAGAATGAKVTLSTAAAALGVATTASADEVTGAIGAGPPMTNQHWALSHLMESHTRNRNLPERHLPPHIAGKRSWSPTYKASVFAQEQMIMDAYFEKMRRDTGFFEKAMQTLGIDLGEDDAKA